jgi:hypothetical protein
VLLLVAVTAVTAESVFYIELVGSNIKQVLVDLPTYLPKPAGLSIASGMPEWETEEEFNARVGALVGVSKDKFSGVWDECKRCPRDASGSFRFRYVNGDIQANANVLNIQFATLTHSLDANGVLRPLP